MAITIKKANMPKTDRGKENAPAAERRGSDTGTRNGHHRDRRHRSRIGSNRLYNP